MTRLYGDCGGVAVKKGSYQIPFDQHGNQQHYPAHWWGQMGADGKYPVFGPEWRENHTFIATLTVTDYARGRSAAYFELVGADGRKHTMFLKDFIELLRTHTLERGKVTALWTYTKRGQNYGIMLATPQPEAGR